MIVEVYIKTKKSEEYDERNIQENKKMNNNNTINGMKMQENIQNAEKHEEINSDIYTNNKKPYGKTLKLNNLSAKETATQTRKIQMKMARN